jgi:hypothetical protein
LTDWVKRNGGGLLEKLELAPGEHYARIWRGGHWPDPENSGFAREWREAIRVGRMLATRLQEVFRYLEPVSPHKGAYSHELRMLFVLACMEVESACKEILFANGTPRGMQLNMGDYRKLAPVMRLPEWEVRLSTNTAYPPVAPFAAWAIAGSGSLSWFQDHHAVKHGREQSLDKATLGNTIEAVAAVFIMLRAQFGYPGLVEASMVLPADEFVITKEPTWTDADGYLPPDTVGIDGLLVMAPIVARPHPKLA